MKKNVPCNLEDEGDAFLHNIGERLSKDARHIPKERNPQTANK
jgi:hypothetical protein